MNSAYVYLQLYRMFDKCTPVKADCGEICGSACCRGTDCGMYLFPGEKRVYELLKPKWIKIEKSDFQYSFGGAKKHVSIAFCDEHCDRYQRPLACRIFPLTPILSPDGTLEIIIDPRSKSVCPIGRAFELRDFEPQFVKNVKKTFTLLLKNQEFRAFMQAYSDYLRDFQKFI